jgi:hypothetical protein
VLEAELFVVLEAEADGDRLRPLVLDLGGEGAGRHVLAFDRVERLAAFLDEARPYAAVSGRSLVAMLAGAGLGVALNPDVAPSASMIGAEAVAWLAGAGGEPPAPRAGRVTALRAPVEAPAGLVAALEARLGAYAGVLEAAHLATAEHAEGDAGLVLALVGLPAAAEGPVAAAVDEALRFGGLEGVGLDLVFLAADAPARRRFAAVGLTFRPEREGGPDAGGAPGARAAGRPPRLR